MPKVTSVYFSMSSRVIVKNLPPYLTQQQLLDHFKASFAVTDCKLVTTHDGKSRKFGFVGFKTTKDATDAIKYFDKTYLHTCRITVDEALAIGSNQLTRPWSKYSEGSSGFQKTHPKEIADNDKKAQFLKDAVGLDENDQKLKEYLQVMKPHGASTKTWGNDDVIDAGHHLKLPQILNDNDKGLYQELPSEDIIEKAAKEDSSKQSALDTNISDMDYLRSKMKKAENDADIDVINVHPSRLAILDESGAFNSDYNNLQNSLNKADVEVVEAESYRENENEEISADIIADTGRIMARNLAYSCTQEDLEELFKPFGLIVEIHIPISRETKNSKGYGFILYVMPENALKAFETLDKTIFQGRILYLNSNLVKLFLLK
jgi:multiple RNA-binding domain-containing protein 1